LKDPEVWRFEAKVCEKVIKEWLAEYADKITIIKAALSETPRAVVKENSMIKSIVLSNGQIISGDIFVEAGYEGDLLDAAGISWTLGRESSSTYNESLAGVRAETLYRQFDVPLDPYNTPGDPSSGLLFGISDEPFGKPGDGDKHLQSYSYRLPLTDDPKDCIPFTKPNGYDPTHYELHRRYLKAGGAFYMPNKRIPGGKTDLIGSEGALSTDLLGMNDDWPTATYADRAKILHDTATFTKGLLYFIATDPEVPQQYRDAWSCFGYCRDEFPDNDHFPYELYVRDARRIISDYIITEATATSPDASTPSAPQAADPVAIAYWPTDTHSVRRILDPSKVTPYGPAVINEGFIFKDGHRWRPFGISYRALVPKRCEAGNLLAPTCPSSSHVGYGAVRLEHQFWALGQVCGIVADLALRREEGEGKVIAVQDLRYEGLRERLVEVGVVVDVESVGVPTFV